MLIHWFLTAHHRGLLHLTNQTQDHRYRVHSSVGQRMTLGHQM